jgi:hypothetical protein
VQSLLDAGALLVGKANLHEIGLGTTGLNTVHGAARPRSGSGCGACLLVWVGRWGVQMGVECGVWGLGYVGSQSSQAEGQRQQHPTQPSIPAASPRAGTPRNPHDVARHTGGSSSGSAALVAAGICPIAVGECRWRSCSLSLCRVPG